MKRNITITIEEHLAKEAKVLAAEKDTSISQLLADKLKEIVNSEKEILKAKKDFLRITQKKYKLNYSSRTFKRNDLYGR